VVNFRSVLRAVAICVPLAYFSLGAGLKENIIIALLPAGLVVWRYFNNLVSRMVLVGMMFILLAVITSFVTFYRERVWIGKSDASIAEIVQEYSESAGSEGFQDSVADGLNIFLIRSNATYHHGWAISLADTDGFIPREMFAPLTYVFIPRFLWPGKPEITPGLEHSARLFGDRYIFASSSSTAAGYFPALYMGGGIPIILLGAALLGWMIARLSAFVVRYGNIYSSTIFYWGMVLFALRLDETWPVYALSGPIVNVVYIMFFGWLIMFFLHGGGLGKRKDAGAK